MKKILIVGAGGQIGSELTVYLRKIYGNQNVVATDMRDCKELGEDGPFEVLNALRAAKDGRQPRQIFERDTRLANPTLEMQIDMERLLYHIGKHALTAYNCFEE